MLIIIDLFLNFNVIADTYNPFDQLRNNLVVSKELFKSTILEMVFTKILSNANDVHARLTSQE